MIINSQRNSNTLVQGSSFNGGNLAQSFNLQGMSIINAYFRLVPPIYTNSAGQNANQSVLMNEAGGNPLLLPIGGCILAVVISTNEAVTSDYGSIWCYIGYTKNPRYNHQTNTWEPPDGLGPFISIINFSLNQLQIGTSSNPFSDAINAYPSLNAYMGGGYQTIKPSDAICKVKLLIINPTLAQ